MSAMFPSRKRRTGEEVDGLKPQETKRSFAAMERKRDGGGGSMSALPLPSPSQDVVAGATAPKSTNNSHVQVAIHMEVQYSREGKSKGRVPENTLAVFQFVKEAFVIPNDFEKDHKFGPLSGVSHEMRVVSAFMAGQLVARSEEAKDGVKMCLECGQKGHFPRYCPMALLDQ